MKRVVIVGGGFAGVSCARRLASNPDVHVTLIDKNNYQQFQPLLYQVLPQLASVAQQAGYYCADHIAAAIAGKPGKPFHYFDKGIMAMIGRNAAVAEVGKKRYELTGPIAFAAWLGVHDLLLIPTRAKIEASLDWAWDYFGGSNVVSVLDRPDQVAINWQAEEEMELLRTKS